jgi:hypothetical protein
MRGRREKPVEFGHKILISETPQKFFVFYFPNFQFVVNRAVRKIVDSGDSG